MKVGWRHVLSWRLGQQLLDGSGATVVDVARRVAGVQAQVMSSAEMAIGVRSRRPPGDVRAALWDERSLVRTWAMRGTLHVLPADELPTWVAALRAKDKAAPRGPAWERYHRITVAQLEAVTAAVRAVVGAEPLTRAELGAAVAEATGDAALGEVVRTSFGGSVLKSAAAEGWLCSGPDRGGHVTFVDPRVWRPGRWREPDAAEALAAVVHRFLDAYGPATEADFARWWGVPPADGKRALRPLAGGLVAVELDGVAAWLTPAGADGVADARPRRGHVRLLPAFDTYVFAPHGHRRHTWPEGGHDRISRAAGWITPTLVVDGRIAGVWAHRLRGGSLALDVEAFVPLSARVRGAAEAEAAAYGDLLGAAVEVSWVDRLPEPRR